MAECKFKPKPKKSISVEYHPVDWSMAEAAAKIEGMEIDEFIALATHEKVGRVRAEYPERQAEFELLGNKK